MRTRSLLLPITVALLFVLVACNGGESTETSGDATPTASEPTATTAPPTATAIPEPPTATAIPEPTSTTIPTATPVPLAAISDFGTVGVRPDLGFGWFGTQNYEFPTPPCSSARVETLVTFTIDGASEPRYSNANYLSGSYMAGLAFNSDHQGAALMRCGNDGDESDAEGDAEGDDAWSVEIIEFDENGRYGETLGEVSLESWSGFFNVRWLDDSTVAVTAYGPPEGDDFDADTWFELETTIDADTLTATTERVEQSAANDDDLRVLTRSDDGAFTWFSGPDPLGRPGCEGFGTSSAIYVSSTGSPDDATPALPDRTNFAWIQEMDVHASGLVTWSTSCEGNTGMYAGRLGTDGQIVDDHWIDLYDRTDDQEEFAFIRSARADADGYLVVAAVVGNNPSPVTPRVTRINLNDSPMWINTRAEPLTIDDTPVAVGTDDRPAIHLGETTSPTPQCGDRTVYTKGSGGFRRLLPVERDTDTPVDVDVTAVIRDDIPLEEGSFERLSFGMVISTECPDEYDGRRIVGGFSFGYAEAWPQLVYVDDPEIAVAEVLSASAVTGDSFWNRWLSVEVQLLDGTVTTLELRDPDAFAG